jgi:hypothetical protein
VLIDVTPAALQAGFRFPVAVTAALMAVVETIPEQYSHEDIEGRLWDVLWMASLWPLEERNPDAHGLPLR